MIVDTFAGPGGWDHALALLGHDAIGIEHDAAACTTRAAAGLTTIRADVAAYPLEHFPDVLPYWQRLALVLEGLGYRTWAGELNAADYGVPQTRKRAILTARRDGPACFAPPPTHAKDPGEGLFDMLEPWVSMAEALGWGMTARPYPTIATSRSTGGPDKEKVGGSGARAAIYEERDAGRWTVSTGANSMKHSRDPDQIVPYERPLTEPAPTVDAKAVGAWQVGPEGHRMTALNTGRDWKEGGTREDAQTIPLTEPAPAVTHQANAWWLTRPATTVVGSFRPDVIAAPGWRTDPDDSRQDAEGSVRVTIPEVLVLQGFPPDYPLRGSKTKQYEQVGNAIPPPLAAAILAPLL